MAEDKKKLKLIADHISFEYDKTGSNRQKALDDVSFVVGEGEFVGLIGHTGSGKSTLMQHLNALLKPDAGTIWYDGQDIYEKGYDRKELRRRVGLVFQYPEHQLFEDTVFNEVCFGPKNFGMDKKQAELSAFAAIKKVGLPDECFYQSPFDLSGGQKRRVAIASVLAVKPEILIMDEPTAGLDPKGREELMEMILSLKETEGISIVLVSHSMEDVAKLADRIAVMDKGRIVYDDVPRNVFAHYKELEEMGLAAPEMMYVMQDLRDAGFDVRTDVTTIEEAKEEILKLVT